VASRAETADGPAEPRAPTLGLRAALRRALVDCYYQSIRLVPANIAWGIVFVVAIFVLLLGWWPPALLAAAALGVAWVGVVRLAVLIVRGHDVVLSDVPGAWRRWLVAGVVGGSLFAVGIVALWVNVLVGLTTGGMLGGSLATLAGWGLILGWLFALAFWPILLDPDRDGIRARDAARLAALLVLARPIRIAALGVLLAVIAIVSTVLIAAIVTVSAAFIAMAAAHLVLPAADDLEARLVR
jgi:hypothetical protein